MSVFLLELKSMLFEVRMMLDTRKIMYLIPFRSLMCIVAQGSVHSALVDALYNNVVS